MSSPPKIFLPQACLWPGHCLHGPNHSSKNSCRHSANKAIRCYTIHQYTSNGLCMLGDRMLPMPSQCECDWPLWCCRSGSLRPFPAQTAPAKYQRRQIADSPGTMWTRMHTTPELMALVPALLFAVSKRLSHKTHRPKTKQTTTGTDSHNSKP